MKKINNFRGRLTDFRARTYVLVVQVKRNMQKIYPLVMGARAIEKFGSKPVKVDEMALLQWRLRDAYDAMKDEQAACETQVQIREDVFKVERNVSGIPCKNLNQ